MTREHKASVIARYLVAGAMVVSRGSIHLSVVTRQPLPFPTEWGRGDVRGVSFARADVAAAIRWALGALLAGYTVHFNANKNGWGVGRAMDCDFNRMIKVDMPLALQQLQQRGTDISAFECASG